MPSIQDLTGILSGDGFDAAVDAAGERVASVVKPRREEGLAIAQVKLDEANLSGMSEAQLSALYESIAADIITREADVPSINEEMSFEMEAMLREARAEAVKQYELNADEEFAEDDPFVRVASRNTAGAFAVERDLGLAADTVERAIAWTLEQGEDVVAVSKASQSIKSVFEFFERAWGPKAERHYWSLSCGAWTGQARNSGILASFEAADLERAKVAAVIDERTSHICRLLHQKEIIVSSAIAQTAGLVVPESTGSWLSETPSLAAGALPGEDPKPQIRLPDGRLIATRQSPHLLGDGQFDMGRFDQFLTDEELAGVLGPPPYHFLCRTLLVPIDWDDPLDLRADVNVTSPPAQG